jgi:hypothetical protein
MAGNTTTANLMQTAVNAASTLVAAYVGGGLIDSVEAAREAFNAERDAIFATLGAQPNEAPKSSGGSGSSGGSSITVEDARNTEVKHGKFAGVLLGTVFDMPASKAAEYEYGEGDKSGKDYVRWLSGNDKNPFLQRRAKVLLEAAG